MENKKFNLAIFIPAPGNFHSIPRKFVRLLNNKPLIYYSIELSKELTDTENIIVINDDEEIDLVVRRLQVVSFLIRDKKRFPRKFGEKITLGLLNELEAKTHKKVDFIIWLGPSSPLLRARDIREAINYLNLDEFDAIFSASEEPQRGWVYTDTYQPSFREISNSSRDGQLHKETGSFFIMKREAITNKGYIGKTGRPFYLHETHSLEINSFNDWWVAEKLLKRKQILFVVAGYPEIGMGHVYRSLALAQEFNNHEVQFLCTKESFLAQKHISENLYRTYLQRETESLQEAVLKLSPDLVINDILDTSQNYIVALKEIGVRVVNFEDEGDGAKFADIVINALYEEPKLSNMLVGYKYFEMREEFFTAPKYCFNENINKVLITFGGADCNNLTLRVLKQILPIAEKERFSVDLITGPGYIPQNELKRFLLTINISLQERINWVSNGTKKISEYMAQADFAITSAGRTVYELSLLRIPSIIIAANERELRHTFGKHAGLKYLGLHSSVSDSSIKNAITDYINFPELRDNISKNLAKFDFNDGKKNITKQILEVLEKDV